MRGRAWVILLVVAAVLMVGGTAGAFTWAVWYRVDGPSTSRAAADRRCERAYVVTPVDPPRTTLPALDAQQVSTAEQPTTMAWWPPDKSIGVVGDRAGKLFATRDSVVEPGPPLVDVSEGTEQEGDGGLLSAVYDPDGSWLYVWRATNGLDDVLEAYPSPGGRPTVDGAQQILFVDHPSNDQHHGGGLAFGPDGYLYVGTGDGGGLGDPKENAQDLSKLLGKLLRIDPTPGGAEPYEIPPDNPFVDRHGARPEIYAYGLRNPFRFTFDGGDLWLPDIGHSCWEEINVEAPASGGGWNFGWDVREGTHPFENNADGPFEEPIFDYSHLDGHCVIIGGYRYHGRAIPALDGAFLFTDYCAGRVLALWYEGPDVPVRVEATGIAARNPVAIEAGPDGEPLVVSLGGDISRIVPSPLGP